MPSLLLKVSIMMPVEKGDMVMARVEGGYARIEVESNGIYLGPNHPIISHEELEMMLLDLRRIRARQQRANEKRIESNAIKSR